MNKEETFGCDMIREDNPLWEHIEHQFCYYRGPLRQKWKVKAYNKRTFDTITKINNE